MGRIKLGMVGGGNDAFIGAVHRIAARMDDRFELVAGALRWGWPKIALMRISLRWRSARRV